MSDFNVDYGTVKDCIIKSCNGTKRGFVDFVVDLEKLNGLVNDTGLTVIPIGKEAERVNPDNIPFLNEYFEKTNLSWFNEEKFFTVLSFIVTESIDDRARELLSKIKEKQVEDPDIDKVACTSELLADYPCYSAVVASYRNDDPQRNGRPSYIIMIRANKIVIRSSNYQYNYKDMS